MTQADPDHAPELSAQDARQARWNPPVFVVLIVSTLAAGLVLTAIWAFWSGALARAEPHPSVHLSQAGLPDHSHGSPVSAAPATEPSPPRD